jgi:hypothetical protein
MPAKIKEKNMANDKIEITFYSFDVSDPQITKVIVRYRNLTEPGHPFWGGGQKEKSFPARIPTIDILTNEIASLNFLSW